MVHLDGTTLVFGASRGLGRAIVAALVGAGRNVAAVCRRAEDAEALVSSFGPERILPLVADVTDLTAVEAAVAKAAAWRGKLSGLVNNAGVIEPIAPLGETDPKAWAHLMQVNVVGPYHTIRAALPYLLDPALGGRGVILNVSSGAAGRPMEGWSGYCTSKAALAMLTRSVVHEYAGRLRCYGFRPGTVDTDMQASIRQSGLNPVSKIPQGDLLKPEIPAGGIAWLMMEAPQDLDGQEVDIRDPEFVARMQA